MSEILDNLLLFAISVGGTIVVMMMKDCADSGGGGVVSCALKQVIAIPQFVANCGSQQAASQIVNCTTQYPDQNSAAYYWCVWKSMWAATGGPIP